MHRTYRKWNLHSALLLLAAALGLATVTLAGEQDAPRPDHVMGSMFIGIDTTRSIQLSTKKKIKSGTIERPSIAKFERDPKDATLARITGVQAGLTYVDLVDENDAHELYQVIVEPDLEYVRHLVQENVPGSNVRIDAAGAGGVLVSGTVDSPEIVQTVLDIVQTALGGKVVNNMRVIGVQQVQLCVVVAEVSRNKLRNMSFAWDETGISHFLGSALGLQSGVSQTSSVSPGALAGATAASLVGSPGNLFLGLVNDKQAFWGFFQALKNESLLKLLAEPTLNCESGRQGSFLAGGEQAIPVPAGLGQVGVQFEEFGVRLNYVPTVLGNGRIRLEFEPEVSDLNAGFGTTIQGTVVPGRVTQRVHTTVEMEAGQSYVIGGLIRHSINSATSKVPVIGELPYVGLLFSSKTSSETEDELLIIITPEFVAPMDCAQVPKTLPGQETRTPDDFELFLEGILEAPRGPRTICVDHRYNAAWKSSPTAAIFPCTPAREPKRSDGLLDYGTDGHDAPGTIPGTGCAGGGCNRGDCHSAAQVPNDMRVPQFMPVVQGNGADRPTPASDTIVPMPTPNSMRPQPIVQPAPAPRMDPGAPKFLPAIGQGER